MTDTKDSDSDDEVENKAEFALLFDKDNYMLGKFKPPRKTKHRTSMPAKNRVATESRDVIREKANEWIYSKVIY